jgi:ribosomal protein S1
MATEQELKKTNPLHEEFQNLLDEDFKDRKLKEGEIIKAVVTEITKNFIVVDCKAKIKSGLDY